MSRIKEFREKAGMTQFGLARIAGVKRSTVAMWETGRNMPHASKLPILAESLNCTVDELLSKSAGGKQG